MSWAIPVLVVVGLLTVLGAIAWNERRLRQASDEDEPPAGDV